MARDYLLPGDLASKYPSRTLAGDWNADLRPDVVLLADGSVCFQHAPDTYSTNMVLPTAVAGTNALDIEALPRADGTLDLLVLGAGGLRVLAWDAATQAFVLETTYASNGWDTAKAVRCADLDGNSLPDFLGITGNSRGVLMMRDFTGTSGIPLSSIQTGAVIQEVEALDWTGAAPQEAAVRLASSVRVYSTTTGSLLLDHAPGGNVRVMDAVRCLGEADERLALVYDAPVTGDDWLGLVGNAVAASNLHLAALDINGAGAADIDGDLDEDLVLTHQADWQALVLINESELSAATPFQLSGIHFYPAGPPGTAAGNKADPCLADFDHDGDVDLALAVQARNVLRMQRSTVVSETDLWARFADRPEDTMLTKPLPTGPLLLQIHIEEPPASQNFMYDGLEVKAWRQGQLWGPVDPLPSHAFIVDLAPGFESWDSNATGGIFLDEPWGFDAIYHFQFRFVDRVGGTIVEAGPTATYFYTHRAPLYLELYDAQPPQMQDFFSKIPPAIDTTGAAYIGGGGPSSGPPPPAQ